MRSNENHSSKSGSIQSNVWRIVASMIAFVCLCLLWEMYSRWRNTIVLPGIWPIAKATPETWLELAKTHTLPTFIRLGAGYGIGLLAGSLIGIAVGLHRRVYEGCLPFLEFFRSLPATALFPLFLTVFGNNDFSRMMAAIYITMWITAFNMSRSMRNIEPARLEYTTVIQASLLFRIRYLYFYELSPAFFSSARVTLSLALLVMVAVEMLIGTRTGIGKAIFDMHYLMDYASMFSAILYVGVIGLSLNKAAEWIERRLVFWHPGNNEN